MVLDVTPSYAMARGSCRCDMEGRGCGFLRLHGAHIADGVGFPQGLTNAEARVASSENVDMNNSSTPSLRLEGGVLVLDGPNGQTRQVSLLLAEVSCVPGPSDAPPLLLLRVPVAGPFQIGAGAGPLEAGVATAAATESAGSAVVPAPPKVVRPFGPRKRPTPAAWLEQRSQRRDRWLLEVCECSLPEHRSKVMQELLVAIGGAGAILKGIPLAGEARPIGSGSYAHVVSADLSAAFGPKLGSNLVAKVPHSSTPDSERAFRREIEVLAAVQGHPGIVRLFGVFNHDDKESDQQDAQAFPTGPKLCVALELCSGGNLSEKISKSNLPEMSAKAILHGVLDALLHLHRREYVHRDVKAENVLLRDNGEPVLADFGLAFRVSEEQECFRRCGSLGFAAPEIILGSKYNELIDIWSSGVMLFAMLCGSLPFTGDDDQSTMQRTIRDPLNFRKYAVFSEVTPCCKELIHVMLQKDPECRPSAEGCLNSPLFLVENSLPDDLFRSPSCRSTATALPAKTRHQPSTPLLKSRFDKDGNIDHPHQSARDIGRLSRSDDSPPTMSERRAGNRADVARQSFCDLDSIPCMPFRSDELDELACTGWPVY